MPTKTVKLNAEVFENFKCENFNYCFKKLTFHVFLNMLMFYQYIKRNKSDKANYKPVSVLPSLFKVYKKLMY